MQEPLFSSETESRSIAPLIIISILLPPVGLFLLWRRADVETGKKVFASIGLVALTTVYALLIIRPGIFLGGNSSEARYTELERHRAQQREAYAQQQAAGTAPEASANSNTDASAGVAPAPGSPAPSSHNYWTDFRGPARDGRYEEMAINTNWPQGGLRQLWKEPIGGGYASFVIAGGVAFTIEQRRAKEVVAAYDVETGREIWTHEYDAEFKESMGGDGPRATPTWNEGRVYSMGAVGDLRCLDAKTGKLVWAKNILSDNGATNLQWGMSAAPLIVDDKVIVLPGGPAGKSVVAYNKMTGARVWSSLGDTAAYTSPMLVTLRGKRQILAVTASRVVGLDTENGSLLWSYPWNTNGGINCSQPVIVDANRFIISAGYSHGAALVEVVANSSGGLEARKVWENNMMKNKFNSSVIHNGYLYGLDEGILACIDIETGERKWKGGRYNYGQMLLASGHLIVITEEGNLVLVRATPDKFEELANFQAIEGKTWNNPAITNGRLLVRNQTEMACFDLSGR